MTASTPGAAEVVRALRATRRRRRLGEVAWGDLAYRVYTTSLAALVIVVFASGLVGDGRVAAATVDRVADDASGWIGLVVGLLVAAGVRSGRRGGPLAMEAADVHHLLSAPLDRRVALRSQVTGLLGYGAAGGAVVGALAGALCAQRLPGGAGAWWGSGALFGAATVLLVLGAAMVAASRSVPAWWTIGGAALLLGWSAGELLGYLPGSPTSVLARTATWPLRFSAWSLLAIAGCVAVAVAGARLIGSLSIEQARRRTALVGQLRFAVTQQDLRSVLLLRRQLANELPRSRPLLRVPSAVAARWPVAARDLRSVLRWPAVRLVRVLLLGLLAAVALRGVAAGTTPLVLVAGIAGYLAALDALEPLAQEVDHPTARRSYPIAEGRLLVAHLVTPFLTMLVAAALGLLVVWALAPAAEVLSVGAIAAVTWAAASIAGAAISIVSEIEPPAAGAEMMSVEVAGPRVLFRLAWPPLVATAGGVPVLVAQRAVRTAGEVTGAGVRAAMFVTLLVLLVVAWVRFRSDLHEAATTSTRGAT